MRKAPEPSTAACQYLLPSDVPRDPDYNPGTWHVERVGIETWIPGQQPEFSGGHFSAGDACGDEHGWFYVPAKGGRTSFELCPASCVIAAQEGAELRVVALKPNCD